MNPWSGELAVVKPLAEPELLAFTTSPVVDERPSDEIIAALFSSEYADQLRLASCLTGDRCSAEDLVIDAFTALHTHWGRMRKTSTPALFLCSEVILGSRTVLRQNIRIRRRQPELEWLEASSEDAEVGTLAAAVRALPTLQREVTVCRCLLGLTEAETAGVLHLSARAVRQHEGRAREALAVHLVDGAAVNTLDDVVRADQQRLTGQVQVTEEDLHHAKHRYRRHLANITHQRRVHSAWAAAAAAAVVVGGGAVLAQGLTPEASTTVNPADESTSESAATSVTLEDLDGTWVAGNTGWLVSFDARSGEAGFVNAGDPSTLGADGRNAMAVSITATGISLPATSCDLDLEMWPDGTIQSTVTRLPDPDLLPPARLVSVPASSGTNSS